MPSERDKAIKSNSKYFQLQTQTDVVILRLLRFGHEEQLEIAEEMLALVEKERPSNLIIDLTQVLWGYAILWERLVMIRKSLGNANCKLAICLAGDTLTLAKHLHFDEFLPIYSSVEDALTDVPHSSTPPTNN